MYEPVDPEETPKGVALPALKEIEFDRETGKLSDADYELLKGKYTAAALEALRAEEAASAAGRRRGHDRRCRLAPLLRGAARRPALPVAPGPSRTRCSARPAAGASRNGRTASAAAPPWPGQPVLRRLREPRGGLERQPRAPTPNASQRSRARIRSRRPDPPDRAEIPKDRRPAGSPAPPPSGTRARTAPRRPAAAGCCRRPATGPASAPALAASSPAADARDSLARPPAQPIAREVQRSCLAPTTVSLPASASPWAHPASSCARHAPKPAGNSRRGGRFAALGRRSAAASARRRGVSGDGPEPRAIATEARDPSRRAHGWCWPRCRGRDAGSEEQKRERAAPILPGGGGRGREDRTCRRIVNRPIKRRSARPPNPFSA